MHRDPDFLGQIEVVERITAKMYGNRLKFASFGRGLRGGVQKELWCQWHADISNFCGRKETNRLLGQVDPRTLEEFLSRTLVFDKEVK